MMMVVMMIHAWRVGRDVVLDVAVDRHENAGWGDARKEMIMMLRMRT